MEQGGQHTLLGAYTGGGALLTERPEKNAAMRSLSFFVRFPDMVPGTYTCVIDITFPEGGVVAHAEEKGEVVNPGSDEVGASLIMVLSFSPFPIRLGRYKVSISVDGKAYQWDFPVALAARK